MNTKMRKEASKMPKHEKRPGVDRTPAELLGDLLTQLKFLRQECAHYDAGDWTYGAQIAVKLRVLLHRTGMSHSLLGQITERFAFSCPDFLCLSTVRGEMSNKGRTDFVRSPLIQYQMTHRPDVPPVLTIRPVPLQSGKRYERRAFRTWWDGIDVVLIDREHFLTRKGVVCLLANEEGGAHIQPEMGEDTALLRRREASSLRITAPLPDGTARVYTASVDQVLAAVARTIAEETLYTFRRDILPRCRLPGEGDETP